MTAYHAAVLFALHEVEQADREIGRFRQPTAEFPAPADRGRQGRPHRRTRSKALLNDYRRRADNAGMTWERAREHDDAAGESPLFTAVGRSEAPERAPIDFEWVRREMCSPMGANGGRTRTATSARSIAASRRRSTSSCGRITAPARSSLSITRASAETGEAEKVVSVRPAAS